jgi:hypothetical protein
MVKTANINIGDTFTMDVAPRLGWFGRLLVDLRLRKPPAKERRAFRVVASSEDRAVERINAAPPATDEQRAWFEGRE